MTTNTATMASLTGKVLNGNEHGRGVDQVGGQEIVQQARRPIEHSQSHHKGGHLAPGVPQAVERAHQHAGADSHGENGPGAKVGAAMAPSSGREGGIWRRRIDPCCPWR